jgi:hypothetical protein
MSPNDPGRFINPGIAKHAAEPPNFLPSGGDWARVPDKTAGGVPLATGQRPSGPVDSPGVDPPRDLHSRLFDPFDDPCNYLG